MENTIKTKYKFLALALILAVVLIGIIGANSGWLAQTAKSTFQPAGPPYEVNVGFKKNANYLPLFVALENGYFKEAGVNVKTAEFDSTNSIIDALASGRLDATPTGNAITQYALENAQPGLFKQYSFEFFTSEHHSENFVVRKGSGINALKDLENKTIGVNKGVFARTMVRKFLEQNGIRNAKIIELTDSLQISALETGQIDALISLEPIPALAVEKGAATYFWGEGIYARTFGFDSALSIGIVSTKFIKEHPSEAKKFLRAMQMAIEFISSHEAGSRKILAKTLALDENVANEIPLLKPVLFNSLTDPQKEEIQKTADFLANEKIIEAVNTQELILDKNFM